MPRLSWYGLRHSLSQQQSTIGLQACKLALSVVLWEHEGKWVCCVVQGYAWAEDKEHCEEYGRMLQADPSKVSQRAKKRGLPQVCTHCLSNLPTVEAFVC